MLRSNIVPALVPGFYVMSPSRQDDIISMVRHSCRMHLVHNFAGAADRGLLAFEVAVATGENPFSFKSEQSGSLRLIRTSAKAFTKRGCDKAGVHQLFEPHVRSRDRQLHLLTHHGHRFNVCFTNGANLYYHVEDITSFFDGAPSTNNLLHCISFDIRQSLYIAGCRAFGIMGKKVTEPLLELVKSHNVLDINKDLLHLHSTLQQWSADASSAFEPGPIFAYDWLQAKSASPVTDHLFSESGDADLDALTQLALECMSSEMLILLERQAEDQLPGGSLSTPSQAIVNSSSNVPADNRISEHTMACLDNILKIKPAAVVETIETIVMWQSNKPQDWLSSLEKKERDDILKKARQTAALFRQKYADRRKELKNKKLEILRTKQQKIAKQEEVCIQKRLNFTKDIEKCGGVWGKDMVHSKFNSAINDLQIKTQLQSQIRFHRYVLKAKCSNDLFKFSSRGEQFTPEELRDNLLKILDSNYKDEKQNKEKISVKDDYIQYIQEVKQKMFKNLLDARYKRTHIKQFNVLLPIYLSDPRALIGKSVFHKCVELNEEGKEEVDWFHAKVNDIKKKCDDPLKTEYSIEYDIQPGNIWVFPLLVDLKRGDLVIELM